ncbi:MAG: DUF4433 domain-containing protein [Deltaproteobacteria bacterium]|nr:DUF4433 domain-containing protein [Deltaproteobacteria bacterium]
MPIPAQHQHRFLYHFTHLENLENSLRLGLLSYNQQLALGVNHHSIADSGIQERRSEMVVPIPPGGVVHDYVPLYFTKLSPMLLSIVSSKNVDQLLLVHFAFPISLLDQTGVVFTNHAANGSVTPAFYSDPNHLDALNWKAIDSTKWGTPERDKQARMAEALVRDRLDPRLAARVYVWNDHYADEVRKIYNAVGAPPPNIAFSDFGDSHSFVNFAKDLPDDMRRRSLAPGPVQTKSTFDGALERVLKEGGKAATPTFAGLSDLLAAFRSRGLLATSETNELVGLLSANDVHKEDVGTHTLKVVASLVGSEEYKKLKPSDQMLAELAAYLHDIGKGPKSRWSNSGGKQKADPFHPLRSLDMLVRLLVEDVGPVKPRHARALCMLVCYHDLPGDIVGNGRKKEYLLDAVESERELDMLIALGRADAASVVSSWEFQILWKIPAIRDWCLSALNKG